MRKLGAELMGKEEMMVVATMEATKSGKIKALFDGGLDVKEISAILEIRYNHVYNVLQNYIIVNEIEVENTARGTSAKRGEIEAMLKDGYKLIEVAKATKTSYNYIWKISQELNKEEGTGQAEQVEEVVEVVEEVVEVPEEVVVPKSRRKKGVQA